MKASKVKNLGLDQLKSFFMLRAKKAFIKLRYIFVEALILNHFNQKYYI